MARQDERRAQYTEENGSSLLGTAIKVGAIAGAGAVGWRYRRQIGSGLRHTGEMAGTLSAGVITRLGRNEKLKETMRDMGAFAKAMHYATDSRGALSHMKNPGRFNDRFEESLQYSLEARGKMKRSDIDNEAVQAVSELQDVRNAKRMVRQNTFEAHRFEYIKKELSETMPEAVEAGLNSQLSQRGNAWFYNMSHDKVEGFTNTLLENQDKIGFKAPFVDEVGKQKFQDQLFEVLSKFESRKAPGFAENPEARRRLRSVEKKMFKAADEGYIKKRTKKDDFQSRVMANVGYHRATNEDLKMHKDGDLLTDMTGTVKRLMEDSRKTKSKDGHVDARIGSKLSKLMEVDPRYRDLIADDHLWINARGEFLDTRWMARGGTNFLEGFRQSVQVPFLRFNPLDLMHFTTFDGTRKAPKTIFKQIGTIDPALHGSIEELKHPLAHNEDARVGVLGRGYMNTADGKLYDLTTGDLVKEDVYQTSGRFGMMPRAMAGIGNLHSQDYRTRSMLGEIFDIGRQETESIQSRMASTFTKFDNPEWGRNIHNALALGEYEEAYGIPEHLRKGLSRESAYKLMYAQLESKTENISYDVSKYINDKISNAYGDIGIDMMSLNTDKEIMSALGRLNTAILTPNSGVARVTTGIGDELEGLDKLINSTWQKAAKNETQFMHNQRILPNNAPYMPEFLNALDMHETDLVKKTADVKRLIQMHGMRQLNYAENGKLTVGKLVQEGIDEGVLPKSALKEVNHIETLTDMRQYWEYIYENPLEKESALAEFASRVLNENDALSVSTQKAMKDMNPIWSMGPGQEPPQYFGYVSSISMNKGKGYKWALQNYNEQINKGSSPTAAVLDSASEVFGQIFAGRKDPGKVTTATLPGYYLAERLDNAVAQVGLGLSQKNRGSMQSILANQFGRRIVLPYVAYQQAVWLDGVFGDFASDKAAETYANMHEDVGHIKEFAGLNDIGRQWSRVFSGSDQITETPLARAFNFATLGLLDHKSGDEIREFYESGEVAVRKGRFWGIGSSTPYTGGKVNRYVPNWYRRAKSDYQFTDTQYGSESEYWANNWMPTLTNPLAPVRHFFLDPYHYEKKHEEDRPYPISGGFAEFEQIPLVGSALNNTVGRVLKPNREHPDLKKAHRAYIEEINNNIKAQYEAASEGGYLQGMPAGGTNTVQGVDGGPGGIDELAILGVTGAGNGSAVGGGAGSIGASGDARQQLAAINSYYNEIGGPSLGATGKNVRSLTALEDLRDPDVLADLADIGTMSSMSGTLRDSVYSAGEMGGIYGFLGKTVGGFDESGRGMTLEQSTRMSSYARAWWDLELGGMGGQISEIGRRYVPRDPNKNYWNPIKNTMPEWLPGSEYFTDFKHGDPYVKVPNGEMRLPGDAYEKLYELHPDALGDYGAFDRFRILADVAPYSENYKFYRKLVSQMNQSGTLTDKMKDEYAEIRDQVSTRKKKYRFYDRRFDNADVQYENVTITRMLDATTFLTKEHPNNPIRMAGVKVKSDDIESQTWLEQYVHEGAKVRIAVDDDPLFRVRDDTYNTMRAVVYANKNAEMMPFYSSTKGQNVNFMLANRKTGGLLGTGLGGEYKASVHDDGSATATRALFSQDMVTVGKMWETTTHDILPKLPIVGTIADKFMQIRSPLEMYKRQEVYGKAWRPWTDPIGGWLQPMFESLASQHPVVGAMQGAGIGWLFAKKGTAKFVGTRVGAVIGGGLATARVFLEQADKLNPNTDNETWLPSRRRKERDIDEYFDKVKYVKYRGLYERARREALRREGVDIEALLGEHDERGAKNKGRRKTLESMKKHLSMNKKLGYGDKESVESQLDMVRADLKEIEQDRPGQELGRYSMLALRYKAEYESTLYGADENGDMTKIFRALPSKDREFFTEFMKAAPKEREEILRLVPKNQRRFYQAKWGMDTDKKESLTSYFAEHHLPGKNWKGWKPDTSLENYKVKVIKNEGLELTEFGYWGDDEKRAEASDAKVLPIKTMSSLLDVGRLEKVLRGAGLTDVSVSMQTQTAKGENKINLAMDVVKDRSGELVSEINNNLGSLFG